MPGILRSTLTIRTFVAIEIPELLKAKLDRSVEALRSSVVGDLVRWVRPDSMHLTLKFLGEIEQLQVNAIEQILDRIAGGFSEFGLEMAGFGCFPNKKRPRVIWVGFDAAASELLRLQAELTGRLEVIGFEGDRWDYHPHMTLGRVRKELSAADSRILSDWAKEAQIETVGKFQVESISLIHSVLEPGGAVYTRLHSAGLAP